MRRTNVAWLVLAVFAVWAGYEAAAFAQSAASSSDSGGGFISLSEAWQTTKSRFVAGGGTMWAILAASTIGLASLLERIFRLTRKAFVPPGLADEADRLWKEGKYDEIEALCGKYPNSILSKAIVFMVRKRESDMDSIGESVGDLAGREVVMHQMFAYPMIAVSTICPLFGLLGTVIGIIETFEKIAIAGAMGDPSMMAEGISKALVCTAFGLLVAIPMLFVYHMVKLRTQALNRELEEQASMLISDWFMKGKKVRS
jgi:biopolymer transport protein ExbB